MANPFFEGLDTWSSFLLDKISFRVHINMLNLARSNRYRNRDFVTINRAGGEYFDISLHAEGLFPLIPLLRQIAEHFAFLAVDGVFRSDINLALLMPKTTDWDWANCAFHLLYLRYLEKAGFIWSYLEIAADIETKKRPIKRIDPMEGHKYRATLYSDDGRSYKRTKLVNGIPKAVSKGGRKDLIIEYNRTKKINYGKPTWRIEFRLSRHHLERLPIKSLILDFYSFVYFHENRLAKFIRKAVPAGTWSIPGDLLSDELLLFKQLVLKAGWVFI